MELKEYYNLIKNAQTKAELQSITYLCLKEEGQTVNSKKYNNVIKRAIEREIELGL